MKIVLQDRDSLRYFQASKEWTENLAEARDFDDFEEPIKTCEQLAIRDAQLVITFDGDFPDLKLRIGAHLGENRPAAKMG